MSYATIAALRSHLAAPPRPEGYDEKMNHRVPDAEVVDREGLLLDLTKGKRVIEFGASGPISAKIQAHAAAYLGVDRVAALGVIAFDVDDIHQERLPTLEGANAVVCGEVLEHLSNPGWFLTRLARQYPGVPMVVTVPNAFTHAGREHMLKGIENVNRDHVAWYSYKTLKTLLERHGYQMRSFCWYRGVPFTAEGLIALAETTHGEG